MVSQEGPVLQALLGRKDNQDQLDELVQLDIRVISEIPVSREEVVPVVRRDTLDSLASLVQLEYMGQLDLLDKPDGLVKREFREQVAKLEVEVRVVFSEQRV